MMNYFAIGRPSEIILEAKVTRADGTVEDLGEIAHYYRNPFKRLLRRMIWRLW